VQQYNTKATSSAALTTKAETTEMLVSYSLNKKEKIKKKIKYKKEKIFPRALLDPT
jgi:hypothetical protein